MRHFLSILQLNCMIPVIHYLRGKKMFYKHQNYKGGTNNLLIVFDNKGNYATKITLSIYY